VLIVDDLAVDGGRDVQHLILKARAHQGVPEHGVAVEAVPAGR
jgi:hypothetical protein